MVADQFALPLAGHRARWRPFVWRIRFFAALTAALLLLLPLRLVGHGLTSGSPSRLGVLFQRMLLWGLRIRVTASGKLAPQALVVANHISWTDILVLGSLGRATFVAKSEVRDWPLLGLLARLNGTVFVRRLERHEVARQIAAIAAALARSPVILFPEGTTGDGADVLPFRPTLFAAAADHRVQPVSILYRPRRRAWVKGELAWFSWDGDKEFWPHLLAISGGAAIDCHVIVHSPMTADVESRKALAVQCRDIVRAPLFATVYHREAR